MCTSGHLGAAFSNLILNRANRPRHARPLHVPRSVDVASGGTIADLILAALPVHW
jgi:hypothetical protein